MKKLNRILAMLLAVLMVCALCACGSGSTGSGKAATSGGSDIEPKTIGYVTISGSAPWGGSIGTYLKELVEGEGWTFKYLDAETDADKLNEHVQTMIDQSVDALVIFGGDRTANIDNAKKASEAGIAVFMAALDVGDGGQQYCKACVGPDQEQAFYDIGKYIIEDNGGAESGALVCQISGVPFLDDYIQRQDGFARAMKETNYDVKEYQHAYSDRSMAKSFMEQFIQAYGDGIDILLGYDDDLTMGAVQAIDEAGMTGKVKVYSFTGQNDAIQAVKDGKMVLTVMNRAGDISNELLVAMKEYFSTGTTEYYHYTPLTYIDSNNVDEWIGKGEF